MSKFNRIAARIPRKRQYKSIPTIVDNITFPSRKEARRYCELKLMKQAGVITGFELQPEFEVFPGFRNREGKEVLPIHYVADFKVIYPDGHVEYEDVKPSKTYQPKVYKLKKKLFQYRYPELILKEVY